MNFDRLAVNVIGFVLFFMLFGALAIGITALIIVQQRTDCINAGGMSDECISLHSL